MSFPVSTRSRQASSRGIFVAAECPKRADCAARRRCSLCDPRREAANGLGCSLWALLAADGRQIREASQARALAAAAPQKPRCALARDTAHDALSLQRQLLAKTPQPEGGLGT